METVAQEKVELRRQLRAKLAALSPADVRARSAAIWERLATLPELAGARRLLIYVSKDNEVDTHGLIQQLLAMGRSVCVPSFDAAAQQYVASELRDFHSELVPGKFGILEPRAPAVRPVAMDTLEAMLVPGLGFDETGNRLGRGMGFFDRILREARQNVVGLAYDFQLLSHVPAEAHDARLDMIVTETRVINVKGKST